jgi:hypothetical protein
MRSPRCYRRALALLAAVFAAAAAASAADAPGTCHATSGARTVPLVELFTSEGCDSCPPADRWLSMQFPPQSKVVSALVLAYHVDYWDRLGWRDRFASAQFSQRQRDETSAAGGAFVYTPQVLVQGRDTPGWNRGRATEAVAAAQRRSPRATLALDVTPGEDALQLKATARVADQALRHSASLWIAYADSGHVTDVAAGENRGAQLRHDHVVRSLHGPFSVDAGGNGEVALTLQLPVERGTAPTVVAFVQDTGNGSVLQAIALSDCR